MIDISKYSKRLPPLSQDEFSALRASIADVGMMHPIIVDEDGHILDGYHRWQINNDAVRTVRSGLTESEKEAFVYQTNFARRNLSADQQRALYTEMRDVANRLRAEDPKKWTQKKVANALGVSQGTVSNWNKCTTIKTNNGEHNAGQSSHDAGSKTKPKPDARQKIPTEKRADILLRVENGEKGCAIAKDLGVSPSLISKYVGEAIKKDPTRSALKQLLERTRDVIKELEETKPVLLELIKDMKILRREGGHEEEVMKVDQEFIKILSIGDWLRKNFMTA